jgi:hypothetical protein
LKTYDDFVVAIDIAGLMGQQRRGSFCIGRQHSLLSFLREIRLQLGPDGFCAPRWLHEKVLIPAVRRDVPDNEIANVDGGGPTSGPKAFPAISGVNFLPKSCACFHGASPGGSKLVAWLPTVDPELPRSVFRSLERWDPWHLIYVKPTGS